MPDLEIHDLPERLKEGVVLAERGALDKARPIFDGYLQVHPESALALSYSGMILAVRDGVIAQGIELCTEAVRRDPKEALCHLNLARVYFSRGDRYQCVRVLHKGLKLKSPHRGYLMAFYSAIGRRRSLPVKFLSRNNPINALLGKLSWKLKGDKG